MHAAPAHTQQSNLASFTARLITSPPQLDCRVLEPIEQHQSFFFYKAGAKELPQRNKSGTSALTLERYLAEPPDMSLIQEPLQGYI